MSLVDANEVLRAGEGRRWESTEGEREREKEERRKEKNTGEMAVSGL